MFQTVIFTSQKRPHATVVGEVCKIVYISFFDYVFMVKEYFLLMVQYRVNSDEAK